MALGAAAWYGGSKLPPVPGQQVGPSVFPMVIGAGLVLCGAMIALRIGAGYEEEAEAELAAHQDPTLTPPLADTWINRLKVLLPPLLLFFYVLAIDRIGFVPTAAVIVLTTARALGSAWGPALLVTALAPPFVHLVFSKLLRVPLPTGLLPLPW